MSSQINCTPLPRHFGTKGYDVSKSAHMILQAGFASLLLVWLAALPQTSHAQATGTPPLSELLLSPDVSTTMPYEPGGNFLAANTQLFVVDPATAQATGGVTIFNGSNLSNPANVDAYDASLDAFSIDISANVDSFAAFFMRPGEVFTRNGVLLFDPVAAGLPHNTNVDALSVDPVSGDLLFSVAQTIGSTPGLGFILPSDVIRWNGTSLSLFFDGGRVPRGLNLDALQVLDDSTMLMSFDTSGTIDGFGFRDEELLEYDPVADSFDLRFATAEFASDWFPADVNALYAVLDDRIFADGFDSPP